VESLARGLERRSPELSDRLTAVVVSAPAAPAGQVIARHTLGTAIGLPPSMAWAPRAGDEDEWSFVGWGTAARIHAAGQDRFAELRARGDRLFDRMERAAALPFAPRLFGGFSFDPAQSALDPNHEGGSVPRAPQTSRSAFGDASEEASSVLRAAGPSWGAFGDASFVLPRVLYGYFGSQAFLAAFVPEAEATAATVMLDELRRALGAPRVAMPAPPVQVTVGDGGEPAWNALVSRALAEIDRRTFAKVVLCRTRHLTFSRDPDAPGAFAFLDAHFGDCTRFFFKRDAATFLGASPERLLFVRGRRVVTEALAGSIARSRGGDDPEARARLLASDKDRAEHTFVIDAVRDALAPSCESLTIRPTPEVRSLSHVHHLATPIVGTLSERSHVLDLVRRLHPTPALCGSPKAAARAFILANEPAPRGWYGGGVGWFDARGDGAIAVAIRSALLTARDAWIYAGAGIVRGSDPSRELAETIVKERAMRDALGAPP